jgi:hypothetical protein
MAMAIRFSPSVACLSATAALVLAAVPAWANDCCVTMSSSSSELTTLAGASHAFAAPGRFLVQTGFNWRDVTGSFNERGAWTPKPRGSSLSTLQGLFGLTYFPSDAWSVGIQLPMAANRLHHAQWGALGALGPLDDAYGTGPLSGGGLGDLALQGSAVVYRGDGPWPSLALWAGLVLPSGRSSGSPADFTGSGLVSGQLGLTLLKALGPWELTAGLGYQRPMSRPAAGSSTAFTIGQVATGQAQVSVELFSGWRVGMGASGYAGTLASADPAQADSQLGKLKLMPSVEWRFAPTQGVRAAYGADPGTGPQLNAMSDQTLFLVYYRYF